MKGKQKGSDVDGLKNKCLLFTPCCFRVGHSKDKQTLGINVYPTGPEVETPPEDHD